MTKPKHDLPRGVTTHRHSSGKVMFRARVVERGRRRSLGLFATPEEAGMAYQKARGRVNVAIAKRDRTYVYFIQETNNGAVKIGRALEPVSRLRFMQTNSPAKLVLLAVFPGGPKLEGALHRAFAHYRKIGEWFDPGPDLLALVEELRTLWERW